MSKQDKQGATESVKRLQMMIPADMHKRFKMACIAQDKEMTVMIQEILTNWLNEYERVK
ncbi:hypothetical protein B6T80_23165 [Salmonella enterica subsp. enterica serovar Newport]|nr:hypothetical protein [Salmonella enterica subsp. enterica serovar Newport]